MFRNAWPRLVVRSNLALLASAAVLALVWLREIYYVTATTPEYLQTIIGWLAVATAAVAWISGAGWFLQYVYYRFRRREQPAKITQEQIVGWYLPLLVDKGLRPALHSPALFALLLSLVAILAYALMLVPPPFLPPGATMVVTPTSRFAPETRHHKHVFIAARTQGALLVLNEDAVELKSDTIMLGSRLDKSEPNCVAVAPSSGKVFVTDAALARVYIIDKTWQPRAVAVGPQPRCVAVSSDERKAYVSSEQPAPYGTISVLDVDRGTVVRTIKNVNCPEGLAVSRDGRRLYVATQCGGDHDPLLVIDTATDKVIATIADVAVGLAPAVSPDGKRIYVSRHNPRPGERDRNLLSVYSTSDHRLLFEKGFDYPVVGMSFSGDGVYLLAATGPVVRIFKADTLEETNQFHTCANDASLACWPIAIAVSDRGALYAMTRSGNIRFTGLAGLLRPGNV